MSTTPLDSESRDERDERAVILAEGLDVTVVGAGPTGMLVAAACARVGLRTAVVDPNLGQPWPNRYGLWCDELGDERLGTALNPRWSEAVVHVGDSPKRLSRAYARVDSTRFRAHLEHECRVHGATLYQAKVEAVSHDAKGSTLGTDAGTLHTHLVIAATGPGGYLIDRVGPTASAFQTAYGMEVTLEDPHGVLASDAMTLMDFSSPGPAAPELPDKAASFLYGMPLGEGRYFLEETVLAARPAIGIALLEARLRERLASRGCRVKQVHDVERCHIPMDPPLPRLDQRIIGFGAAASLVHPATGYMLGHCTQLAPSLADVLRRHRDADPESAARAAWRCVWPAEARRRDALYRFGLELLLTFDEATTRVFFDAFFDLPEAAWRGYLSRELTVAQLSRAMMGLYRRLNPELRHRLHRGAWRHPGQLVRGLVPGVLR